MALFAGIRLPGQPDLDNIRRLDALVIPQLNRMSRYGISIDIPYLRELSSEFGREMEELQKDISSYVPRHALDQFVVQSTGDDEEPDIEINAGSADQIRKLVFDLLAVGRNQKLKTTSTGVISTGRKQLELVREQHPVIPLILQYRERAKLKSAFCDSLPTKAKHHPKCESCPVCELSHVHPTNRLHTTFATTRAITGRLSSRKPNLQQIPVRSDLGSRIRGAFLSSPGTQLVSVDFSQMEIRDLAHLANARSMIRVYESNGDIHTNTAMKCFGIADPKQVDKYKHRLPSKRVNFGIQNGTTEKGLYAQLVTDYWAAGMVPPGWLTEDWCKSFIMLWHSEYNEVQPYFDVQYYRARRYHFVWNPFGRVRWIPQVLSQIPYKVSEGLREAQNFPVTSSNAEQTKLAMIECEDLFEELLRAGVWCWPLLSIHDQVIAEVEEEYAKGVGSEMVRIFRDVMNDRDTGESLWRCPIDSDCEILERWKMKE
jgi:DNA polymerase-1